MVDCEKCLFVSVCKKRPKMPGAKIAECNTFRERLNKERPMTNADRIRAMSDAELAEFIRDVSYECQDAYCGYHCPMCAYPWCSSERTMEWLKQPAEGE